MPGPESGGGPSADELAKEHRQAAKAVENTKQGVVDAYVDRQDAVAAETEVLSSVQSEQADKINARVDRASAERNLEHTQDVAADARINYNTNIKEGAANAPRFIDEARAEMEADGKPYNPGNVTRPLADNEQYAADGETVLPKPFVEADPDEDPTVI